MEAVVTKGTERRAKLTKRSVDAAKPEEVRYILWDEALAGFGLRVEPTGRKTFIARYRAGGGRTGVRRQPTLGQYGTLTVDEARTNAKRLLGKAAGGGDPLGDKLRARQAGITVAEMCDWYLRDAAAGRLLGRRGKPIKASTLAVDTSRIQTHVKPLIGRKPVSTLSVSALEAMQADIATGKTALKTIQVRGRGGVPSGGSGVAARTLGMLQAIIEHARRAGLVTTNPAKGARKLSGTPRRQRLSLDQVRALGAAMRQAHGENPVAIAALRFITLSGFRRNEALAIRAGQVVPTGGVDLPDSKSGPQVRPVGKAALHVLGQRSTAVAGDSWLFPAERGNGHFVGLPKVLRRLSRVAQLPPISIHTLRHTFASVAAEIGLSELVISGLLGHRSGSVTAGYVHLDSALVAAADRVAETIAGALDEREEAELVLRMPTSPTA